MGQGSTWGRIVALSLALLVGGLAGYLTGRPGASGAGDVVTAATLTVEATVTAPAPEAVTVTVEPGPTDDPAGPKANGSYLVGSQLAAGTWQCSQGTDRMYWAARNSAGDVVDNDLNTIAIIENSDYIADLTGCSATWTLVP